MCGIAGAILNAPLSPDRLARGLVSLRHRGPDANGSWQGRMAERHVALLHTRLAIIDLDRRADQPFIKHGLVLVYNGELYNYVELRAELTGLGHTFETGSDTEVVLEAYHRWGSRCVERFDGMWALALFDPARQRLWLSRDRFGEKPLFCLRQNDGLFFASEIKTLEAMVGRSMTPNRRQLHRYLVNGYRSLFKSADTWFDEVAALPPAHGVEIDDLLEWRPEPYWSLAYDPQDMSLDAAIERTRALLLDGLERRLRADVPLAFCLSGGVDSGALACIAAKHFGAEVHGFSIVDEDPRYDERDTLLDTVGAIECRHTMIHPGKTGFLARMRQLVTDHDSPVSTISYYVHAQLSEAIRAEGYKVAISGTGADEMFTGYYDHYHYWLAEFADAPDFAERLQSWQSGYGQFVRNRFLKDPMDIVSHPARRDHIYLDRDTFNGLMRTPFDEVFDERAYSPNVLRNRMLNELREEVVPVLLHEDDLNSMRVSIENRSPYLDHRLAEFAFSVPNEHLIANGCEKWLLRAAVEDVLPDSVRLDRRKRGFNASIDTMLDRTDQNVRDWCLADGPIFDVVDRDAFIGFFDDDMSENSFSKFLFSFVSAKMFLEREPNGMVDAA